MTGKRYDFKTVEQTWRPVWDAQDLYRTGDEPDRPDIYILDYFPYPSGAGLSVGHGRNYVPSDVSARFHRMRGYNVLHPMGWDAFGLPAESYAVAHGVHPRTATAANAANFKRQLDLMACSYDWSREINSTDPDYYRWTQWFFLLLYKRGLAYRATGMQWWCPQDETILANEQVENGKCWRCGTAVVKKELTQWYFRITDYADRLLADLDSVDWPEPIKIMQRNWIGRSEGTRVVFQAPGAAIDVFTTRPDTLFGATFVVLAPEHPAVARLTTSAQRTAVDAYVAAAQRMSDIDRMATDNEKTGVFTGAYAQHPLTGTAVPIWIADYVLMGYGTGAIMAVPAHDERDFAFARRYGLPIVEVITPDGTSQGVDACTTEPGIVIHSERYSGMPSDEAGRAITADLSAAGTGQAEVSYRMRDWLISRQRYWGAPIPMIHCARCGMVPVPETALPVVLPEIDDYTPMRDGRSPLARATAWVQTTCPQCGGPAERDTDTMDGFACSSWYFLRFADPHYDDGPFNPAAVQRWLPVDTYVGGAEHAVMHLLYARFWTKVMADAGLIMFDEPFAQLLNQGMLLSAVDGQKMSKSKGNVVTPDEIVARHGTDALRTYLLFLGPFDAEVTWNERGMRGVTRFLDKVWTLAHTAVQQPAGPGNEDAAFERARHRSIQRVTWDMARFRFNTAVAALMEYVNSLSAWETDTVTAVQWRRAVETIALLLAPIAPFIAEEIWQTVLAQTGSVHVQAWPAYDPGMAADAMATIVVQVNGKLRERVQVPAGEDEAVVRATAVASPGVQRHIDGRTIRQIIVVPDRLVNIVV